MTSPSQCPICLSAAVAPVSTACHHTFCLRCLQSHLSVIATSIHTFPLPCPQCRVPLNSSFCLDIMQHEPNRSKLEAIIIEHEHHNNIRYCSNSHCAHPFDWDDSTIESCPDPFKITCPFCKHATCVNCRSDWHDGETCDNTTPHIRKLAQRKGWKTCPKCATLVEKQPFDCHFVRCRCGTGFCFRCGRPYTSLQPNRRNHHGTPSCQCGLFDHNPRVAIDLAHILANQHDPRRLDPGDDVDVHIVEEHPLQQLLPERWRPVRNEAAQNGALRILIEVERGAQVPAQVLNGGLHGLLNVMDRLDEVRAQRRVEDAILYGLMPIFALPQHRNAQARNGAAQAQAAMLQQVPIPNAPGPRAPNLPPPIPGLRDLLNALRPPPQLAPPQQAMPIPQQAVPVVDAPPMRAEDVGRAILAVGRNENGEVDPPRMRGEQRHDAQMGAAGADMLQIRMPRLHAFGPHEMARFVGLNPHLREVNRFRRIALLLMRRRLIAALVRRGAILRARLLRIAHRAFGERLAARRDERNDDEQRREDAPPVQMPRHARRNDGGQPQQRNELDMMFFPIFTVRMTENGLVLRFNAPNAVRNQPRDVALDRDRQDAQIRRQNRGERAFVDGNNLRAERVRGDGPDEGVQDQEDAPVRPRRQYNAFFAEEVPGFGQ